MFSCASHMCKMLHITSTCAQIKYLQPKKTPKRIGHFWQNCRLSTVYCGYTLVVKEQIPSDQFKTLLFHGAKTSDILLLTRLYAFLSALSPRWRYRRKQYQLLDRHLEASADELYRRPFGGHSSVVENVSRPNSIRRVGTLLIIFLQTCSCCQGVVSSSMRVCHHLFTKSNVGMQKLGCSILSQ